MPMKGGTLTCKAWLLALTAFVFLGCSSGVQEEADYGRDTELEILNEYGVPLPQDRATPSGRAMHIRGGQVTFLGCQDTDEGMDSEHRGTIKVQFQIEGGEITNREYEDVCKQGRLIERYCNKNAFVFRSIKCESCSDGICNGPDI